MKIYVTKSALTKGIKIYEQGEYRIHGNILILDSQLHYVRKPYWHKSKEKAIIHAEKLRKAEIQRLENKIVLLKLKKFE